MLYYVINGDMENTIEFSVSAGMDGYYVATATGTPIVTQGKTLDELVKNIAEASELYLATLKGLDEQAVFG